MKIPSDKLVYALIILVLLAATGVTAFTATRHTRRPQESQGPRKVHVPQRFLSEVKKLKVESHWIENEGTPQAQLVVVVRNRSELAVKRVSVTISDLTISRDGGIGLEEPETVIEPYATAEFSIPLTNFIDDSPFVISAAVYADATEEGREPIMKWAREDREERRGGARRRKEGRSDEAVAARLCLDSRLRRGAAPHIGSGMPVRWR